MKFVRWPLVQVWLLSHSVPKTFCRTNYVFRAPLIYTSSWAFKIGPIHVHYFSYSPGKSKHSFMRAGFLLHSDNVQNCQNVSVTDLAKWKCLNPCNHPEGDSRNISWRLLLIIISSKGLYLRDEQFKAGLTVLTKMLLSILRKTTGYLTETEMQAKALMSEPNCEGQNQGANAWTQVWMLLILVVHVSFKLLTFMTAILLLSRFFSSSFLAITEAILRSSSCNHSNICKGWIKARKWSHPLDKQLINLIGPDWNLLVSDIRTMLMSRPGWPVWHTRVGILCDNLRYHPMPMVWNLELTTCTRR